MTPEERSTFSKAAVKVRWDKVKRESGKRQKKAA